MRFSLTGLMTAAGVIAAAAAAQPAPQPQGQEIVVEGKLSPHRRVQDFVKELTPAHVGSQLGRFIQPICPRVLGLPKGDNALVEARIRKVAAAVGAPVAPAKCTVDLYVLVGGDKRETMEGIRRQFPDLVAGVPSSILRRLEAAPGPTAAWQIVGQIGADGTPVTTGANSEGDSFPMVSTIGWTSRIAHLTVPQFLGSIVVVDGRALTGVDTRQLADFAAMRTLAPTDSTHQLALSEQSIVQLFDPGVAPETAAQSVTWWDYAYLKALYSTSNAVDAFQQRSEIARKMAKELEKVPGDGE